MKEMPRHSDNQDKEKVNDIMSDPPRLVGEVPRHPKWCPDCLGKGQRSKVKIFNLNEDKEAIYMCSNMQVRNSLHVQLEKTRRH